MARKAATRKPRKPRILPAPEPRVRKPRRTSQRRIAEALENLVALLSAPQPMVIEHMGELVTAEEERNRLLAQGDTPGAQDLAAAVAEALTPALEPMLRDIRDALVQLGAKPPGH